MINFMTKEYLAMNKLIVNDIKSEPDYIKGKNNIYAAEITATHDDQSYQFHVIFNQTQKVVSEASIEIINFRSSPYEIGLLSEYKADILEAIRDHRDPSRKLMAS